jgi:long-chain acyl-CoA synthetase
LIDTLAVNKIDTKKNPGNSLKQIIEDNWDEIFLFDAFHEKHLTYGDFFKKSIYLKNELEKKGIKKGDFLCLILDNSVELAMMYLSSLFLGTIVIPIDPFRGKNEIKEILGQFENKKIISDKKFNNEFKSSIMLEEIKKFENGTDFDNLEVFSKINYDDPFLITFTSGTSGKQKGVIHSFNNLFRSANAFKKKFDFGKKNIFLHNLPMNYMAGILNLLILPLVSESKVIISERSMISNISKFWNIVIKYSANSFWLIPTILELLIKLDRGLDGIEYVKNNELTICVGTSPLTITTKENFENKYNVQVFESYGLSETLFVSTNYPNNDKSSSVGKFLEEVTFKFFDDELGIKTPWMFLGYYDLDEKNFFNDDYYLTGDLGMFKDDLLFITGRKKDIIIKGGINISPRKIEDILNKSQLFSEITVIGFPSRLLGEKIVCFGIKNQEIKENEKKSINKEIVEQLGMNYSIDEFIFVKEIPKNLNGKINKVKIQQIFEKQINDS